MPFVLSFVISLSQVSGFGIVKVLSVSNVEVSAPYTRSVQKISAEVVFGFGKGESVSLDNFVWEETRDIYTIKVNVGDFAVARIDHYIPHKPTGFIIDYFRLSGILITFAVGVVVSVLVGRKKALLGLSALIFSLTVLVAFVQFLKTGTSPVVVFVGFAVVSSMVSLFLILGKKFVPAFSGSILAVGIVWLLVDWFLKWINFTGLEGVFSPIAFVPDMQNFPDSRIYEFAIASVVVASVGAVMDISTEISSTVNEVKAVNPSAGFGELFKSGMNVGRAVLTTMSLVLVFVHLSSLIPIMSSAIIMKVPFVRLLHYEFFQFRLVLLSGGLLSMSVAVLTVSLASAVYHSGLRWGKAVAVASAVLFAVPVVYSWNEPPDTNFHLHLFVRERQVGGEYITGKVVDSVITNGVEKLKVAVDGETNRLEVALSGNPLYDTILRRGDTAFLLKRKGKLFLVSKSVVKEFLVWFGLIGILGIVVGGRSGWKVVFLSAVAFSSAYAISWFISKGVFPVVVAFVFVVVNAVFVSLFSFRSSRQKLAVFGGGVVSMAAVSILGVVAFRLLKITGTVSEDLQLLHFFSGRYGAGFVNPAYVVLAQWIIGLFGAVFDVSVSAVATAGEIERAGVDSGKEVFKRGFGVSRNVLGTMLNTVVFAYIGANMISFLQQALGGVPFLVMLNSEHFASEFGFASVSFVAFSVAIPVVLFFYTHLLKPAGCKGCSD